MYKNISTIEKAIQDLTILEGLIDTALSQLTAEFESATSYYFEKGFIEKIYSQILTLTFGYLHPEKDNNSINLNELSYHSIPQESLSRIISRSDELEELVNDIMSKYYPLFDISGAALRLYKIYIQNLPSDENAESNKVLVSNYANSQLLLFGHEVYRSKHFLTIKLKELRNRYSTENKNLIVIVSNSFSSKQQNAIEDFNKKLNFWKFTFNGIARIYDDHSQPELIAIERGSLWEVFAVSATVATAVLTLSSLVMKNVKQYYDLLKVIEEQKSSPIRALREHVKFLEESAKNHSKEVISNLHQAFAADLDGKEEEVKKHAKEAMKNIALHYMNDGQMEFNLPEASKEQLELHEHVKEDTLELSRTVEELAKLDPERKYRLLLGADEEKEKS